MTPPRLHHITLALLFILSAFVPRASAIPVSDVPNPMATSKIHVQDCADVLSPAYIDLLEQRIRALNDATKAELAVVIVDNLNGDTVEHYATALFEQYGIGRKGTDDGVLVLMSRDDHRIRIEVGYGLEGTINDAKAGRMLRDIAIPLIKDNKPGQGLYKLTEALAREIYNESGIPFEITDPTDWPAENVIEYENAPTADTSSSPGGGWGSIISSLVVVPFFALLFHLIYNPFQIIRLRLTRGRAGKMERAKKCHGGLTGVWIVAIITALIMSSATGHPILTTFSLIIGLILMTGWTTLKQEKRAAWAAKWSPRCPTCHQPMHLLSESEENHLLTAEEQAEERAIGMDYEFWVCTACDVTKRIDVKLKQAKKCPLCKRRTLTTTSEVLTAATLTKKGKTRFTTTCLNPACAFHHVQERTVPRIGSSSSSGGSSSGGGSFGGGSSGGGGASGSW